MNSCLDKQKKIIEVFHLYSTEEKYKKIIEIGRALSSYPSSLKMPEKLVPGCQSQIYLCSSLEKGQMNYLASSDALISAGLAALLFAVYNQEPPLAILTIPPQFLQELGIPAILSPGRSNGLLALFKRMQQEALILSKNN